MAGHSKWKQIKHKKAKTDQDRSRVFSKFANMISVAARDNPDPQFNPTLRSAIEQARKVNMPQANIERAIKRASESANLEGLLMEIYGPEGVGLLAEGVTDNRNRTISEVKHLLKGYDAKLADPGSLMWSFEKTPDGYTPKFPAEASPQTKMRLANLAEALEERDDITSVYLSTNE